MNNRFGQWQVVGLVALAALAGCATTSPRHVVQSREPLQRIALPQPAPTQDPLTLALAGEFALANADLNGAVANYVKAAQASDDPAIAAQATRVSIGAKHWDAAQTAYQRWQSIQPNDPGLWQAHAMLAIHNGDLPAAQDDLQKLLRQPDAVGWRMVAQALVDVDDKKQASDLLEKLATPAQLGSKPETWIAVGQLAFRLGDKTLADTLAQGAVKKFGTAETYIWAAQAKVQAGDKQGARALFAEALHRDG
jgi:tetratricopeptide (TPR) repeat protein